MGQPHHLVAVRLADRGVGRTVEQRHPCPAAVTPSEYRSKADANSGAMVATWEQGFVLGQHLPVDLAGK